MSEEAFQGWAILELMGHRRLGGYVRDVELFGTRMVRIDVPETAKGVRDEGTKITQYYSPSSLYALTPVTEEVACVVARGVDPSPVHPWEMPRPALPEAEEPEEAELEDDLSEECRCCPRCSPIPCPGLQQGGFCDEINGGRCACPPEDEDGFEPVPGELDDEGRPF